MSPERAVRAFALLSPVAAFGGGYLVLLALESGPVRFLLALTYVVLGGGR